MILDAPAIFESDRLQQCSTQADLAYPRLLGISDDWGRGEWNVRKIHARAFPKRPQVREADVSRWMNEYDRVRSPKEPQAPGLLRRYVVDGVEYFEWWAWKGVSPSKRRFMHCPPPPWADPSEQAIWERSRRHLTARRRRRAGRGQAEGKWSDHEGIERVKSGTPEAPHHHLYESDASGELGNHESHNGHGQVANSAAGSPPIQGPAVPAVPTEREPIGVAGGRPLEGSNSSNGHGARPPARAAWLPDHDPSRILEAKVAARCLDLAEKTAALEGREATQDDVVAVQAGITGTKRGVTLKAIRGATNEWLEATLGSADKFEADLLGDEAPLELLDVEEEAHSPPDEDLTQTLRATLDRKKP